MHSLDRVVSGANLAGKLVSESLSGFANNFGLLRWGGGGCVAAKLWLQDTIDLSMLSFLCPLRLISLACFCILSSLVLPAYSIGRISADIGQSLSWTLRLIF